MKFMIVIAAALIAFGGGVTDKNVTFGNTAHAASSGGSGVGSNEYVELSPLILPIVDDSGVSQIVSLVVTLEASSASAATEIKFMAPKLTDAYIQDLYGMLNEHAALKGGVIQIGYIKKRLNKISQRVAGEKRVNDVLLQVVQQRPI